MGKYSGIIAETLAEDEKTKARAAGVVAPEVQPDAMGRAMRVADQRGLPVGVVADNLPEYDQQQQLDEIEDAASKSPVLARWLGDPNHVALSKDDTGVLGAIGMRMAGGLMRDLPVLPGMALPTEVLSRFLPEAEAKPVEPEFRAAEQPSWFSELVGTYSSGWQQGKQANVITVDSLPGGARRVDPATGRIMDTDVPALAASVADYGRRAQAEEVMSDQTRSQFERIAKADETGRWLPVAGAWVTSPRAVMSVVAQSFGSQTPQLALSLSMPASAVLRGIVGGAGSFSAEQGMTVLDSMQDVGVDTSDPAQVAAFMRDPKKMAAARERALKRGVAVGVFDGLSAGFAGRLLANARRSTVSIGARVAGEGAVQSGLGMAGETAGQLLADGKISSRSDIIAEGIAEFPTFILEGRGHIAQARRNAIANADRFDASQEQRSITNLVDLASQSKTRERSAARFESLIRDMTGEGNDTIYLSADGAQRLFQSSNSEGGQDLGGLVDAEALREAIATGGEVAIPLAKYATMVTPELHAAVADQVRLQPGGRHDLPAVSPEEIQQAIDDGLAEAQQQDARENGPAGQVYDDVVGQLLSRQDEKLARQNASVVQSVYRNLAERVGTDAWTLYQQFKINIPGATSDTRGRARDVDIDVDPFLDALRTGKMPTDREIYGDTLVSALHAAGGLRDSGGELANMDAAKLRPGLVNNLAGMSLDDALVWAYQEGFITQAPTNQQEGAYDADAPDINTLLDMLAQDLGGDPVYRPAVMNAERAAFRDRALALQDELDQRGIDLQQTDNAMARQALGYGRTLEQSAVDQTQTPEFKAWFGDSKVVDADGNPLVVYHGTAAEFDTFKPGYAPGWGNGIYFTDNQSQAANEYGHGGRVVEAYVSIKNPWRGGFPGYSEVEGTEAWMRNSSKWEDSLDAWNEDGGFAGEVLRELGYDGVIAKNSNGIDGLEIVAFKPEQIKSATGNQGTFDPNDPRIDYAVRDLVSGPSGRPESAATRALADQAVADGDLAAMLQGVAEQEGIDADQAALALRLAEITPDLNVTMVAAPANANAAGIFNNATNEIWIHQAVPSVVLHEVLHGVTSAMMTSPTLRRSNATVARVVSEFNDLLAVAQAHFAGMEMDGADVPARLRATLEDPRGPLSNIKELLTYGMTDKLFQQWLATVPPPIGREEARNAWQWFKDAIASLLGVTGRERSALDALIESTSDLVDFAQANPRAVNFAQMSEASRLGGRVEDAAAGELDSAVIDSVNPSSHGVFEDYGSGRSFRANAPLAGNMVTLAETQDVPPDREVILYRGIASGDPDDGIQPGDFVTTNKQLAKDYSGTGKVVELKSRYGDVLDDSTEPGGEEYIYRPANQLTLNQGFAQMSEANRLGAPITDAAAVQGGPAEVFRGVTREQFLGSPRITANANAADLRPRALRELDDVDSVPFGDGDLTAKYSNGSAAVFDGDKVVASYNFGDTLVVDRAYRRRGIGEELVYQWRIRNPQAPVARERTKASQALQVKVWDRIQQELSTGERTLYQSAQTDTPEFRAWFGDSKVVDANGAPLVVYHGTVSNFDSFSDAERGKVTRATSSASGFFFASTPRTAQSYADHAATVAPVEELISQAERAGDRGRWDDYDSLIEQAEQLEAEMAQPDGRARGQQIVPVYLSIQNPLVVDAGGENPQGVGGIDPIIKRAKAAGHDGVIIKNFDDAAGLYNELADHYIAFAPEQIKSATANAGTFDPSNPSMLMQGGDTPRGSVTFGGTAGARVFNIELLEGMDASTFMHEMGHVYLEVLNDLSARPDAPAQIVDDMATLNNWLGREAGTAFTVDQHEQFARGFEAYLREGKAPSSALRRTFAAFKVWLTALYRSVRSLNVELTDDVRNVMDRIVASDAEIEEARASQYQGALIEDGMAVGMTFEQLQAYNEAVTAARADAEATVAAEVLLAERREQQAWYNREKREVRAQVLEEVRNLPVYRAQRLLRSGKLPNGDEAPDELRVKLSKDELLDKFGQSFLRNLTGMYSVEGGVRADEAAAIYGFGSGRELVDALVNAPKLADAVASETDARMKDRHPDPMTDGTLPDRAMIAAHRDRQADVMVREIRALEQHVNGRQVSQAAVIKGVARQIIQDKKLRHLQPATYRSAEARAGREAFEAAAKQDWGTALAARRRQLLNFELFREAVRARDEAARTAKYLAKFGETKTRARLGKAGADYLDQVDGLLDRFDFRKISDKAADRRSSLATWIEVQAQKGIDVNLPPKIMDEAFSIPYREMTVADLATLRDAVRAIDHLARLKGKLLLAGEMRDAAEVDAAMAASLLESHASRPVTTGDRTNGDKIRQAFMQGRVLQATATDIARELDGFKDQGAIWMNTVGVMRDAVNNRLNPALQQAQDDLARIYVKHYSKEEIRAFSDRVPMPEVNGDLWSKSRLLGLALNWGNAGNREAILTQARGRMSPEQVNALLSKLDSRDWAFVEEVWRLIDAQWPAIAEAQKRRTGLVPERVQASAFTVQTSDGKTLQIPGGYYPLKYESDSVKTMKDEADDFYNSIRTGRTAKAATRNGHTIERVGSGGRTVRLDTGVVQQHLRDVLRDVHLGDAVNYVHNVLNGQEFKEAVDSTGMQEYRQAMEVWLKDASAGEIGPRVWHERAMRAARQNFTASVLTWKVTSALLQLSGVVPTIVAIGQGNTMAGIGQFLGRPRAMARYVREASPYMDSRLRTHIEAVQTVMDAEAGRFAAGKAASIRFGYWMIGRVQGLVDTVTWLAAEQAGMAKFDNDVARARAYADDVVTRAQGSGEFIDKSAMQRGTLGDNVRQTEWIKATTALQGYMIAKGNLAYEQTRKTNFRSPRQAMKWAADMVMLFSVEGLLTAALTGKLPKDDEDDGLLDDLGEWAIKDTLSTFFGVIPGGGVFVDQFRGYDSSGVVAGAWKAYAELLEKLTPGEDGEVELDKGVAKAAVSAAGVTMGLPSSQINKTIDAIEARADGRDVSPYEYLTGPKKEPK